MVYELLFLVFVKMFLQELGKWLISQWISITLFVLQLRLFQSLSSASALGQKFFAKHCKCRIWNQT